MNAKTKIHQARLEEWTLLLADQSSSGLTVREWCNQNNITIHKYNYWKHLLKEQLTDKLLPDIVPVMLPENPTPVSGISYKSHDSRNSYNLTTQNATPHPISITINDIRIDITASDLIWLPDVIKAVRNA